MRTKIRVLDGTTKIISFFFEEDSSSENID